MRNDLHLYVPENESILYEGRPNFLCFLLESIFNPLLPFAIIWALFDSFFSRTMLSGISSPGMQAAFSGFILLHMMPVWLYLGGIIFSGLRHRNIYYIISDHAVYVSGGIFTKNIQTKSFAELSHVNLHRGIFDQILNVGDITLTTNQFTNQSADSICLHDLSDYQTVFTLLNKLQKDIYADTMYPNDLRPEENHGYKTTYKG